MTSVLILAGSRAESCALCSEIGVSSKALIPLHGVRMIDHVLRALRDAKEVTGDILVSGLSLDLVKKGLPADLLALAMRLKQAPVGEDPASAILSTLDEFTDLPLLVTTCDHPLLSPGMIANFVTQSALTDNHLSVGLAARPVIESAYPHVKRTYLTLGGSGYSGCNLFYIRTPEARKVIDFWRDIGKHRKQPLKIAQRFGFKACLRMLTGKLCLERAFAHGSKLTGAKVGPIIIPIAEAAIDVDKPSDLVLVKQILAKAA